MVAPSFNDEAAKSRYGAQWVAQGSPKGRAHRPNQKSWRWPLGAGPLALAPWRWPPGAGPPALQPRALARPWVPLGTPWVPLAPPWVSLGPPGGFELPGKY